MKALSIILTSALVSGIIMSSAQAESGRAGGPEWAHWMMKMMDANTDGKITKEEFMKMEAMMAEKKFMMMDMNNDGSIDTDEFMFLSGQR